MAFETLKNYPQEREPINAEDISDDTARIQNNFDKVELIQIELGGNNVFTGDNTFSGATLFGNIQISANSIITVDTNGDLNLTPNGTGKVVTTKDFQASNIKISVNTITSENTNGNINLTPNGTGKIVANKYVNLSDSNGNAGSGTISAGATTTVINNTSVTANSRIVLTPTSSGAAADIGSSTGVWVSAKTAGTSFTLTHPLNATTSKTFDYLIFN